MVAPGSVCRRRKISTTRMAAPQHRQTKVGTVVDVGLIADRLGRGASSESAPWPDSPVVRHWRAGHSGECGGSLSGRHVQEEPAHELVGRQPHRLVPGAPLGAVVLPAEGHAILVHGEQPTVGDRHPMGIARQIRQYCLPGPAKGRLAYTTHSQFPQRRQPAGEGGRHRPGTRLRRRNVVGRHDAISPAPR